MIINDGRESTAALRSNASPMERHGRRDIDRFPTQQAATPRQICVFSIGEKIFVEELPVERRILQRFAAIESGGARGTKHVFRRIVLTQIRLAGAAVKVSLIP